MNVNIEYVSVRGKGGEVEVTQVAPGYRIVPSSVTTRKNSLIIINCIYICAARIADSDGRARGNS